MMADEFISARFTSDIDAMLDKFLTHKKQAMLFSGAAGMASVMYNEVKLNAAPPRMGKITGKLADSIYQVHSVANTTDDRVVYHVSWNHKKAPHGHLVEFGTSKMAARPFVRPAMQRIGEATAEGVRRMKVRFAEQSK